MFLISDWKISVNFKGAADARKVLPSNALADLEGGLQGFQPPFQILKIKESNKRKQKIGDNPLEKEEERKSCMFV